MGFYFQNQKRFNLYFLFYFLSFIYYYFIIFITIIIIIFMAEKAWYWPIYFLRGFVVWSLQLLTNRFRRWEIGSWVSLVVQQFFWKSFFYRPLEIYQFFVVLLVMNLVVQLGNIMVYLDLLNLCAQFFSWKSWCRKYQVVFIVAKNLAYNFLFFPFICIWTHWSNRWKWKRKFGIKLCICWCICMMLLLYLLQLLKKFY